MTRTKKYRIQTREYSTLYSVKGSWGSKNGISYTKWKTVDTCNDKQEAINKTSNFNKGLKQIRVLYGNEVVYSVG